MPLDCIDTRLLLRLPPVADGSANSDRLLSADYDPIDVSPDRGIA
jgi:hypothetical protein